MGVNELDLKKRSVYNNHSEWKIKQDDQIIKIIIIIINPTPNDHDSSDDNNEIQVPDQEESGTIDTSHENMSSCSMISMDLSKNKTDKPMQLVIKYLPTNFSSKNRSFQSRWYNNSRG